MHNFEAYIKDLPVEKGNYLLFFQITQEVTVEIGSLGRQIFPAGVYVYAGSALGPGGIRARVKHHLKPSPKPHWHLDYLKSHIEWLVVGWTVTDERMECIWTHTLVEHNTSVPVNRFGASDCQQHCPAHLLRIDQTTQEVLTKLNILQFLSFNNL